LVLRLWPSDFGIVGYSSPVFVGTVELQERRRLTWLITAAMDTGGYTSSQKELIRVLDGQYAMETVRRTTAEIQVNRNHDRFHWQGQVLLVRAVQGSQ
jgi:hypothetical protein